MLDALMRWLGYGLCHQLPERSFFGGGVQVSVCARDEGIYIGFMLSMLVLWWLMRGRRPSELPGPLGLGLAVAFIGVMAIDGFTSYAGWRTTTNDIRLATGLLCGWGMAVLIVPILNGQLWRRPGPERVLPDTRATLAWILPLPVVFVAVRWALGLLGLVFPLVVAASILVTFTAVNLTIISILPAAEGRSDTIRDASLWIALAFGLTLAEISAAAWLRVLLTRLAS